MSGGCLNDSGYSLGRCDVQETKNIQSDSFSLAYYFFSQLPRIGQNVPYFGLSVGCLEGVWEVSGRCLEGVLHTQDCVWSIKMPNQLQ